MLCDAGGTRSVLNAAGQVKVSAGHDTILRWCCVITDAGTGSVLNAGRKVEMNAVNAI